MDRENHDRLVRTYWDIVSRAQSDPEYAALHAELAKWETRYEAALAPLPAEARTVIETYITLRETLNRRLLEFACGELVLPDIPQRL